MTNYEKPTTVALENGITKMTWSDRENYQYEMHGNIGYIKVAAAKAGIKVILTHTLMGNVCGGKYGYIKGEGIGQNYVLLSFNDIDPEKMDEKLEKLKANYREACKHKEIGDM